MVLDDFEFPVETDSIGQRLLRSGVTRRRFLDFCLKLMVVAPAGLCLTGKARAADVARVIAKARRPSVIWLHMQDCTGCTETLLRTSAPDLGELILDLVSLDYHSTVMAAAGHQAEAALYAAMKENAGKYVLVIEGSIPRKDNGVYLKVAGRTGLFEIWTVGDAAEGAFGDVPHRHFGYVQEKDMRSLFSSADLFLYPSRSEGYPLMVVEAFACRCPVVTTEAVPYAITGINAMVSKVGDVDSLVHQVCRVMRSSELAEAIAAHGHAYAHAHTLQSAKNAFENTLKEFCEHQRHD